MTQAAFDGDMTIPADSWLLVSEANCTFVVKRGEVEVRPKAGLPADDDTGAPYRIGEGEGSGFDTMGEYCKSETATGIYMRAHRIPALVHVSRDATA